MENSNLEVGAVPATETTPLIKGKKPSNNGIDYKLLFIYIKLNIIIMYISSLQCSKCHYN